MIRRPPRSTRTEPFFPYTNLFRAAVNRSAGTKEKNLPERVNRIVPVGTTGQATSLRVQSLRALARKVVKQIEAPRSPDPIMRRPCADCEEKRVTYGDDEPDDDADQEQLDLDNPNQRGLSYQLREPRGSRSVALPLRHCGPDQIGRA